MAIFHFPFSAWAEEGADVPTETQGCAECTSADGHLPTCSQYVAPVIGCGECKQETGHALTCSQYVENSVTIRYIAVAPVGTVNFGAVYPASETIGAVNGIPNGAYVMLQPGYRFVGWFWDEACTFPVDSAWVTEDNAIHPVKAANAVWDSGEEGAALTFYAKLDYGQADLTISVAETRRMQRASGDMEGDQSFIITITGQPYGDIACVNLTVVIPAGAETVTVVDLPVGVYTVVEQDSWSWDYAVASDVTVTLLSDSTVEIFLTRNTVRWLYDRAYLPAREE